MLKTKRIISTENASFVAVSLINQEFSIINVVLDNGETDANEISFELTSHVADAFTEFNQIKKNIKSVIDYDEVKAEVIEGKQFAFDANKHILEIALLFTEKDLRLSFLDGVILEIKYASQEDAEKDYKKLQNLLVKLEKE